MDLEQKKTVEATSATNSATERDVVRKTTRRQEIRAALMAVPVVLTLTSNANAFGPGQYGYSPKN